MEPYPFTLGEKIRAEMDQINNYVKMNSRIQFKIMFYRNVNQKSGVGDIIGEVPHAKHHILCLPLGLHLLPAKLFYSFFPYIISIYESY